MKKTFENSIFHSFTEQEKKRLEKF